MKRLTMNQVARANLRSNRKAYRSLTVSILLAVYLSCTACLCIWGVLQAKEQQQARRVGWMDTLMLNAAHITDAQLRDSGLFDRIGHVYVTASIRDTTEYTGYYDETADELMYRRCVDGRLPEAPGEIAAERSALDRLALENAAVGDTFTWVMQPVNGQAEERAFTLVGILSEQTAYLNQGAWFTDGDYKLPAILTSPSEPAYSTGSAVVHRVMTNRPLTTLDQIQNYNGRQFWMCGQVSRVTGTASTIDQTEAVRALQLQQVLLWGILCAALLLSACVAIAAAMESILSRKAEDVGLLRAVGATRRQIRRLLGRDAWLLALIALPVGAICGCLTCYLLSVLMPEEILFRPTLWLILPVLLMAFLCVSLSSALPLRRASRQLPMGVLRDTAVLRRARRFRSRKAFHATRLIAGRQFRLHPLRQAGSACMTALMLLCTLLLGELVPNMDWSSLDRQVVFQLNEMDGLSINMEPFTHIESDTGLTTNDLNQIRALPLVSRLETLKSTTVNLLLSGSVPDYVLPRTVRHQGESGEVHAVTLLTGPVDNRFLLVDDGLSADDFNDEWNYREAQLNAKQMRVMQQVTGVSEKLLPMTLYIITLEAADLADNVTEGAIDLDALDAGRELLLYAPNFCFKVGDDTWMDSSRYFDDQLQPEQWDAVIQNHDFFAGQTLPLLQASGEMPDWFRYREDEEQLSDYYRTMRITTASPKIGAVLKGNIALGSFHPYSFCLITTEKGAAALGLSANGAQSTGVALTVDPSPEQEETLQSSLNRIGLRRNMKLSNLLENQRERWAYQWQTMILFAGMALLFFAVSTAMQVTNASRRIRADMRMIGTLRAVGADERALLGCYRLPALLSTAFGLLIAVAAFGLMVAFGEDLLPEYHPQYVLPALLVASLLNALCAVAGIRGRLRQMMSRSIVENIREL